MQTDLVAPLEPAPAFRLRLWLVFDRSCRRIWPRRAAGRRAAALGAAPLAAAPCRWVQHARALLRAEVDEWLPIGLSGQSR